MAANWRYFRIGCAGHGELYCPCCLSETLDGDNALGHLRVDRHDLGRRVELRLKRTDVDDL